MWSPQTLDSWLKALHQGSLAAAPAEGVYGYVADAFSEAALKTILQQKQRDAAKGFILLIQNIAQLSRLCPQPDEKARAYIDACWLQPTTRPVTLILPALPTLSPLLTGGKPTVAVRLPQVGYMQEYLKAWGQAGGGPLVSTSLNLSGEPSATEASQVPINIAALTLEKPLSGQPSRIFNPATGQWLR